MLEHSKQEKKTLTRTETAVVAALILLFVWAVLFFLSRIGGSL